MKRIVSVFLVVTLCASLMVCTVGATSNNEIITLPEVEAANILYEMGLMNGTGIQPDGTPQLDLAKETTRQEAIAMLIRLIGLEDQALSQNYQMPFKDVDEWAKPYVALAYNLGLTNGISETNFGSKRAISINQYLTMMLRALGYDSNSDFTWDHAHEFAKDHGISIIAQNADSPCRRGKLAEISVLTLSAPIKGNTTTYFESMWQNDLISLDRFSEFANAIYTFDSDDEFKMATTNMQDGVSGWYALWEYFYATFTQEILDRSLPDLQLYDLDNETVQKLATYPAYKSKNTIIAEYNSTNFKLDTNYFAYIPSFSILSTDGEVYQKPICYRFCSAENVVLISLRDLQKYLWADAILYQDDTIIATSQIKNGSVAACFTNIPEGQYQLYVGTKQMGEVRVYEDRIVRLSF